MSERAGLSFEKAVALVQAQFDPAAQVLHNEYLVDRLGHSRQFDVVIRGSFAGQSLLGVVECKDLKRKVNSPEIDAFVTKSREVNANLRMFISRRGFSRQALEKCAHYGIQPLSLLGHDASNFNVFLGTRWEAESIVWRRIAVTLRFVVEPAAPVQFDASKLVVNGKRVLDWFTNHLLAHEDSGREVGWVANVGIEFKNPQMVEIDGGVAHLCRAIEFHAERVCERYERVVAVSGTGFYDWNTKKASFPPGVTIRTEAVPIDFTQWTAVTSDATAPPGLLNVRLVTRAVQFTHVDDAIDLESL